MSGWVEVDCNVAELIIQSDKTTVYASCTDPSGQYGEPEIYTEWGLVGDREIPLMRSWGPIEGEPCRHLVPTKRIGEDTDMEDDDATRL